MYFAWRLGALAVMRGFYSILMFASLTIGHSAQCAMSTGNSALLRM
jgi:hypothetical protein